MRGSAAGGGIRLFGGHPLVEILLVCQFGLGTDGLSGGDDPDGLSGIFVDEEVIGLPLALAKHRVQAATVRDDLDFGVVVRAVQRPPVTSSRVTLLSCASCQSGSGRGVVSLGVGSGPSIEVSGAFRWCVRRRSSSDRRTGSGLLGFPAIRGFRATVVSTGRGFWRRISLRIAFSTSFGFPTGVDDARQLQDGMVDAIYFRGGLQFSFEFHGDRVNRSLCGGFLDFANNRQSP